MHHSNTNRIANFSDPVFPVPEAANVQRLGQDLVLAIAASGCVPMPPCWVTYFYESTDDSSGEHFFVCVFLMINQQQRPGS